jgi:hypothetical protein
LIAYADDITLLTTGNSRSELEYKATSALSLLNDWATLNKLSFAKEKTESLVIKGSFRRQPSIYFRDTRTKIREKATYLGVIFDSKLTFDSHLKTALEKARLAFSRISRLCGHSWGLGFREKRTAYEALFVNSVAYASCVWGHRVSLTTVRRLLNKGQRAPLISLTGAFRTAPTEGLPVLAGVLPLDLHIQTRAARARLRKRLDAYVAERYFQAPTPDQCADSLYWRNIHAEIDNTALNAWQLRWQQSPRGRQTFKFFPSVQIRLNQKWLTPNFWTSQFITGHGYFNQNLVYLGIKDNPECPCSHPEQDADHVLWSCPGMEAERMLMLQAISDAISFPLHHGDLISSSKAYKAFDGFARKFGEKCSMGGYYGPKS